MGVQKMICNSCHNQMPSGTDGMCQSCFDFYMKHRAMEIKPYSPSRLEFFTAAALSGIRIHEPHYVTSSVANEAIWLAKETIKQLDKET